MEAATPIEDCFCEIIYRCCICTYWLIMAWPGSTSSVLSIAFITGFYYPPPKPFPNLTAYTF